MCLANLETSTTTVGILLNHLKDLNHFSKTPIEGALYMTFPKVPKILQTLQEQIVRPP